MIIAATRRKVYVDGEIVLLKGNDSVCRSDFAIKTIALVEAGLLAGYQALTRQGITRTNSAEDRVVCCTEGIWIRSATS